MGKVFGNLAIVRGIIYFRLSPYEQKAYAGVLQKAIPNILPRAWMSMIYWLPPMAFGTGLFVYTEEAYRLKKRKNPSDYINEVDPNPPPPPPPPEKKC